MKKLIDIVKSADLQKIILYTLGAIILIVLLKKIFHKVERKINPDKYLGNDKPVDPNLLPKSKEHYRKIAEQIYSYLKGTGTADAELTALINSLTDEELKVVANHFKEYLLDKGETACGNIVNWLEDDGREDLAQKFIVAGVPRGEKSSSFFSIFNNC